MKIPVLEGHRGLVYNGEETPLTVPSGGKPDEYTQAVEEEGGRHSNTSYSR